MSMNQPIRLPLDPKAVWSKYWHLFLLFLIAVLSFGLNFWAISKVGYGNAYYAAAIKSMTESFHNFFYVSFDPAGLVSVDKPPLGLWVQALFVLVFGYHGWAMLLPQALAATGSCLMMYALTAKHFGRPAGLISSLVFAMTPAVVVAARNNTMDTQLIFVLMVATWFLFKAIGQSKWRYLFLCAFFVGIGFNVKMLQAYMILPAVVIVYLVFAKEKFLKRILAGLISLVIMAAVSFAWVAVVELTPADSRPYVGSSTDNSVLELIIGHNGLERLTGGSGGNRGGVQNGSHGGGFSGGNGQAMPSQNGTANGTPPSMPSQGGTSNGTTPSAPSQNGNSNGAPSPDPTQNGNSNGTQSPDPSQGGTNNGTPPSAPSQNGTANSGTSTSSDGSSKNHSRNQWNRGGSGDQSFGGGMGGFNRTGGVTGNEIGTAGVLRLWSGGLYGQASWLIVFALFCILAKVRKFDLKKLTTQQAIFVFWIIWLVTMFAFFSFASFWHRYYLSMFAPGIAGLSGIGLTELYRLFRDKQGWRQILLPLSLLVTSAIEVVYVWSYSDLKTWLVPVIIAAAALSLVLMALHYLKPKKLLLLTATGFMLVSLLAGPFYWALTVVMYVPENVTMPYAGPELASTIETPGMTTNQEALTTGDSSTLTLEEYLVSHYKEGSYLVVSQRADDVAQFIVDTGLPAVAYGGFLGTDNALTLDQLKELVAEGKVTYFLVSGQGGNSNSELISYVKSNATLVEPSEYGATSSETTSSGNGISRASLYLFH
jgi:4-amino-4-deoxy-L-arabinose transferase-like glycosyltransferase